MNYDIFGLGNPLIDIILHVEDRFMSELKLEKGSMNLVDTDRQKEILKKAAGQKTTTALGGSCANTMVTAAQLGSKVAYGGKVGNDELGTDYENQLIQSGARLVCSADDILEDLRYQLQGIWEEIQPISESGRETSVEQTLTGNEEFVYQLIQEGPRDIEDLLEASRAKELEVGEMSTLLLKLEMRRLIRQLPGKVFAPMR